MNAGDRIIIISRDRFNGCRGVVVHTYRAEQPMLVIRLDANPTVALFSPLGYVQPEPADPDVVYDPDVFLLGLGLKQIGWRNRKV